MKYNFDTTKQIEIKFDKPLDFKHLGDLKYKLAKANTYKGNGKAVKFDLHIDDMDDEIVPYALINIGINRTEFSHTSEFIELSKKIFNDIDPSIDKDDDFTYKFNDQTINIVKIHTKELKGHPDNVLKRIHDKYIEGYIEDHFEIFESNPVKVDEVLEFVNLLGASMSNAFTHSFSPVIYIVIVQKENKLTFGVYDAGITIVKNVVNFNKQTKMMKRTSSRIDHFNWALENHNSTSFQSIGHYTGGNGLARLDKYPEKYDEVLYVFSGGVLMRRTKNKHNIYEVDKRLSNLTTTYVSATFTLEAN